MSRLNGIMDSERYRAKYGKLNQTFPLIIDLESKAMIDELKALKVDVQEFGRDVLIPKLKELRDSVKGISNG